MAEEKSKWATIKSVTKKIIKDKSLRIDLSCPEDNPDRVFLSIRRLRIDKNTGKETFTKNGIGGIYLDEIPILISTLNEMKKKAEEHITRQEQIGEEDYPEDDPDMF